MATGNKIVNLDDLKIAYDDLDESKLEKTGDTMSGNLIIKKTTPAILFYNSDSSSWAALLYEVVDSGGNNRLAFAVRKDGSAGQEVYFFPIPDTHSTQTNYGLLTTKTQVTVSQGGTGGTNPKDARANLHATYSTYINSSTWSDIWDVYMTRIDGTGGCGTFVVGPDAISVLSNGKLTSSCCCIISRSGTNMDYLRILSFSSGQYLYSWNISDASNSTPTYGSVYRFSGTAI